MAKISTYDEADIPLELSDMLIGTEGFRDEPSPTPLATKNFTLGQLLTFFQNNSPGSGVTAVTATSPITSSGGNTPVISTSMSTGRLIGRSSAGVGVMEQIFIGPGLSLSGGLLQATSLSPLTTKGDLYTFTSVNNRLPVGTNGQVLSADSSTSTGLRWITFTGGSGITSLNGLTGATQTFLVGTSGLDFNISSSGTVHNFNLPDASTTARGVVNITAQTFIGTKTFVNDIIVNGIDVGAGPGNINTNVRIGKDAGASLSSGNYNIFIGFEAGRTTDRSSSTVIGNRLNPTGSIFNSNRTLSIGKQTVSFNGANSYPQVWSPDTISITFGNSASILDVKVDVYSALFMDYVITDNDLDSRAGTIKAIWIDGKVALRFTEETTDSIGITSFYTFSVIYDGSNRIQVILTNTATSGVVFCNYTSRLLLKPII